MAVLAIPEEIASRFAPYVRELHELFAMHGVSHGAPTDLPILAARLDIPSHLSEDVSSILRSIILREGGTLPHAELIEILALAVAGPEIDTANPGIQPAFRKLLTFVGVVVRRPWNVPPGDDIFAAILPEAAAVTAPASPPAQVITFPAPAIPSPSAAPVAPVTPITPAPTPNSGGPPSSSSTVKERVPPDTGASSTSPAAGVEPASAQTPPGSVSAIAPTPPAQEPPSPRASAPVLAPIQTAPEPLQSSTPPADADAYPEHDPHTESHLPLLHRTSASIAPLWIGALCAIVLAVAVAVYSHNTFTHPDNKPVAASESVTLPDPVAAPAPKPTPDLRAEIIAPPTSTVPPQPKNTTPAPAPAPVRRPPTPSPRPAPTTLAPPATPPAVAVDSDPSLEAAAADAGLPGSSSSGRSPLPSTGHTGPYFLASSGIMASHLIEAPEPSYPTLARLTHIQGQVILQAVISPEGQVVATRVLSGHRLLRGAAVNAVKQWRYRPYILDGHPVNVATIITVDFHSNK